MSRKKINQNSIIEPTEDEIKLFKSLVKDMTEAQLDYYSNEYFNLIKNEKSKISFAKFVIDKIVRAIQPGDTIAYNDSEDNNHYLFCLIRENIENTDYLLFAKVDEETQQLIAEEQYLFYVYGLDENNFEIIDIVSKDKANRILDIMEELPDVKTIETKNKKNAENQKKEKN